MGVKISDFNADKETMTVQYVPETIPIAFEKSLSEFKRMNIEVDGMSKDRTMRHVGRIPLEFMYNYCGFKGIPVNKMNEYFSADNGKNMKLLLNEFNSFRMVDKL